MRFFAARHNQRGIELEQGGQRSAAIDAYYRAVKSDPKWSVPWYNLGLLFKRERSWRESLDHNRTATKLNHHDADAWWNLGIAATALGEWRQAREAWQHCGIDMPDGDDAPQMNFGLTPIRLNTNQEVVWCDRIDPARAIIRNVPLAESQHRYGDLVLHDGARSGTRVRQGKEVPVFDEIEILEPSSFGTYVATIANLSAEDAANVVERIGDQNMDGEDWTESIYTLCTECSQGRVDHGHVHAREPKDHRLLAFAAESDQKLRAVIEQVIAFMPEAELIAFECVTPPATPP